MYQKLTLKVLANPAVLTDVGWRSLLVVIPLLPNIDPASSVSLPLLLLVLSLGKRSGKLAQKLNLSWPAELICMDSIGRRAFLALALVSPSLASGFTTFLGVFQVVTTTAALSAACWEPVASATCRIPTACFLTLNAKDSAAASLAALAVADKGSSH